MKKSRAFYILKAILEAVAEEQRLLGEKRKAGAILTRTMLARRRMFISRMLKRKTAE